MLLNSHILGFFFFDNFLLLISSLIPLYKVFCISAFKFVKAWFILVTVPCTLEKNVYSVVGWNNLFLMERENVLNIFVSLDPKS